MQEMLKRMNEIMNMDKEWLENHLLNLYSIERNQTFEAYEKAADYAYRLLKDHEFESEILFFPADGKTVYQDKCTPLAWDITKARLTVLSGASFDNPIIADYEKEPLSVVKHSTATPPEGLVTKLVSETQVLAGEDCTGAMVLLEQTTRPGKNILKTILDLGAIGYVSDYLEQGLDTVDHVYWSNAATESNSWHVQAGDRPFIAFNVSPRIGRELRKAVNSGNVMVLVESDGRRYEGEIYAVTGLLPGRQKKELWIMAHLYEPLINDNSTGVIGSIAILRNIRNMIEKGELPPLEFSLRVIFAAEMYGFAAIADQLGGRLHDKVIGAINMDALLASKDKSRFNSFQVTYAPLAVPFFGNYILQGVMEAQTKLFNSKISIIRDSAYADDCFLSDASVGVPTIWVRSGKGGFHHCSIQDEKLLDMEAYVRHLALSMCWIAKTTTINKESLPDVLEIAVKYANQNLEKAAKCTDIRPGIDPMDRMKFLLKKEAECIASLKQIADIPEIDEALSKLVIPSNLPKAKDKEITCWYDYASSLVPKRIHVGFPYDLFKMPYDERKAMPNHIIYCPLAHVISGIDGKKNLQTIINETEWEIGRVLSEQEVRSYITAIARLAEAGYMSLQGEGKLIKEDIKKALVELGIEKGDLLLVHSSNSGLGYIEGGADTIIDSLLEVVGDNGTVLMPTFTRPYIGFEGSVNKSLNFRPYDANDKKHISTGVVPTVFLNREAVIRSAHATHPWAGIGPKAEACLKEHALLDPPASANSPMGEALEYGGKVLFFGCGLGPNTFIHFLETAADVPYLRNAIVKVRDKNGKLRTEVIHKHLPGHRNFYGNYHGECEFYQRAIAAGLEIKSVKLGIGYLQTIDLNQMYDIGMKLFKEDILSTLCQDPNCMFCRQYRERSVIA